MALATIKTTVRLKFRGSEIGHCQTSFARALICLIDNQCSKVVVYDGEFPTGYTAIKHILRESKQMCNAEASATCAKCAALLLGFGDSFIHNLNRKKNAVLACSHGRFPDGLSATDSTVLYGKGMAHGCAGAAGNLLPFQAPVFPKFYRIIGW